MTNDFIKARITEVHKDRYLIRYNGNEYPAVLSGKLMYNDEYPIVGDYVDTVIYESSDALITGIHERSSYISRPDRHGHADGFVHTMNEQPMIANIDYMFIITSLNQNFNVNRILRYAAIASNGQCIPVAVLTKADICPDKDKYVAELRKMNSTLDIVCVSSYTGEGMDKLHRYLTPGTTIALLGSSGVGKSTLVNTLAGKEIMDVNGIREEDAKGRHTTTHRQLIEIDGYYIIDTPGMRELGMCDVSEGIDDTFSDVAELTTKCRFSDCSHTNEPGCAVQNAIRNGDLDIDRWMLYKRMRDESDWAKSKKAQMMIDISKKRKQINRYR